MNKTKKRNFLNNRAICLISLLILYVLSIWYNKGLSSFSKYVIPKELILLLYIVVIYWCILIKKNVLAALAYVNILFFSVFIFLQMDNHYFNTVFVCALLSLLYCKDYCEISKDDGYVFSSIKVEIFVFVILNEIQFNSLMFQQHFFSSIVSNIWQQPSILISIVLMVYFFATAVRTACEVYKSNKTRKQKRGKRLKQHISLLTIIITNDNVCFWAFCGALCFQQLLYRWNSWDSHRFATAFFIIIILLKNCSLIKKRLVIKQTPTLDMLLERYDYTNKE